MPLKASHSFGDEKEHVPGRGRKTPRGKQGRNEFTGLGSEVQHERKTSQTERENACQGQVGKEDTRVFRF